MSPLSLMLDVALLAMLGAALFYCWRLDRRLARLREGQDGMRDAAAELVEAVRQAERAVQGLRTTAAEAGRDLQARIDDARTIADRLGVDLGRLRSSADLPARNRARPGG